MATNNKTKAKKIEISKKMRKKLDKMWAEISVHTEHTQRTKGQYRPCS